jgi:hypothetical protein
MGHSTASMTQRFRAERAFFEGYKRALLVKSDQLLFDEMWDVIETYIPATEKSNHPLLIATILLSMLLEQRKLITDLQYQLEKMQHETRSDQQSQAAEFSRLKREIQRLDDEVDTKLRAARAEVSEMLYPSDATS